VFSKKFFFIDFLDELEFFIGEKQVFTKKKVRHSAVCREFMAVEFCPPEGIGPTGVIFVFLTSGTNSVG
jgi:hypothetical protein